MSRLRPRRGEPGPGLRCQGETAQQRGAPADGDGPPGDPSPVLVLWHESLLPPTQRWAGDPAGDPRGAALTLGDCKKAVRPTPGVPEQTLQLSSWDVPHTTLTQS